MSNRCLAKKCINCGHFHFSWGDSTWGLYFCLEDEVQESTYRYTTRAPLFFVWLKPKLIVIVFYLICNLYGWQLDSRCRSRVHIGPKFDLLNPKQLYQPLFCTFCCRWLYFFFLKLHCFWSWTDIPLTKKRSYRLELMLCHLK